MVEDMPASLFTQLSDDFKSPGVLARSMRDILTLEDELTGQPARSIVPGMTNETLTGRILVQSMPVLPAAGLHPGLCDSTSPDSTDPALSHHSQIRLRRVRDYISTNLDDDITLTDLAQVACLSTFHFARTFTHAFGISPGRYVSRIRLEKAMSEIIEGKLPLVQIALNARFSSQASFTRAFRRATGVSPGAYRRRQRKH